MAATGTRGVTRAGITWKRSIGTPLLRERLLQTLDAPGQGTFGISRCLGLLGLQTMDLSQKILLFTAKLVAWVHRGLSHLPLEQNALVCGIIAQNGATYPLGWRTTLSGALLDPCLHLSLESELGGSLSGSHTLLGPVTDAGAQVGVGIIILAQIAIVQPEILGIGLLFTRRGQQALLWGKGGHKAPK